MPDYPHAVPPSGYYPHYPQRSPLPRLTWLLVLLTTIWLAPYFVERIEYAVARGRERAEADSASQQLPTQYLEELSRAFGLVAKRIGPSVVHVETTRASNGNNGNGFSDELAALFGNSRMVERSEGSGVIVDSDGYILTNYHVIEHAGQIEVGLSDGRRLEADVIGADPATDLAVLKINGHDLIPAEWGDSDALEVGAMVWAIGNPYGLDRSISFGIVSAKNRRGFEQNPYQEFLQTDAAVNPGNSGGPLVNIRGQLVGINTAIVGNAYQGISFAIPSSTAHDVYTRLKSHGKVARSWLGVSLQDITPDLARQLRLPAIKGALVQEVKRGSPAERAGIQPGDVILSWNDQPIDSPGALTLLIARTEPNTKARVGLIRDGQMLVLEALVEERPARARR